MRTIQIVIQQSKKVKGLLNIGLVEEIQGKTTNAEAQASVEIKQLFIQFLASKRVEDEKQFGGSITAQEPKDIWDDPDWWKRN